MKFELLSLDREYIDIKIPDAKANSVDDMVKYLANTQVINDVTAYYAKIFYFKYYDSSRIFDFKVSTWPKKVFLSLKKAYECYESRNFC